MYFQNSENKTQLTNFEGLDVDKMDYLLRDAAALRINLKWEVGPDLRLKFLFFVAFMLLLPFLLCKIICQNHFFSAGAVSGSRGTKADGSSRLGARGNRRDTERHRKQYRGRNL